MMLTDDYRHYLPIGPSQCKFSYKKLITVILVSTLYFLAPKVRAAAEKKLHLLKASEIKEDKAKFLAAMESITNE